MMASAQVVLVFSTKVQAWNDKLSLRENVEINNSTNS